MSSRNGRPPVTWLAASLDAVAPVDTGWVDPRLAARLAEMQFTKRRSETALARWTAKRAVAETFGIGGTPEDLAGVVITNAFDGAPEASIGGRPIDGVIAMTDRADVAVSMVARGGGRVGCDLELVEPRTTAFVRDYFTADERAAVWGSPEPDMTANLIWSAKESALKVLRTGLRRDTRTVAVTATGDGADGWRPLEVAVDDGSRFPGWWLRSGEFLLTAVTETATDPPHSLIDPHGLTYAVPSHAWMTHPRVQDIPS